MAVADFEVEVPDQHVVRTLSYKDAPPLPDPAGAIRGTLDEPDRHAAAAPTWPAAAATPAS